MSKANYHNNGFVDVLRKYSTTAPAQGNLFIEHHDLDLVEELYIQRSIFEDIRTYINQFRKDSIFLTGNAGDGKTTICKELVKKGFFPQDDVIEDFSALIKKERIELLKEVALKKAKKVVACNEGALRTAVNDLLKQEHKNEEIVNWGNWLKARVIIDSTFEGGKENRINVRNLNQKNNSEDAILLLKKMVDTSNWVACEGCPRFNNCPIRSNSESLRVKGVSDSIKNLYDFVHDKGDHVTIRDLLIHLSYTITGGLSCEDVHRIKSITNADISNGLIVELRRLFSENFFGGNWEKQFPGKPLPVAFESLRQLSMGMHSNRKIDRLLTLDSEQISNLKIERFITNTNNLKYLNDLLNQIQVGDQTISKKDSEYFYGKVLPVFRRHFYFVCQQNIVGISKTSRYFEYDGFKRTLKTIVGKEFKKPKLAKDIILALNRYQANSISNQSDPTLTILSNSCLHSALDMKLTLRLSDLVFKKCRFSKNGDDSRQFSFYFDVPKISSIKLKIGLELYEYLLSIVNGINTPEMKRMFGSEIDTFLSNIQHEIINQYKGNFEWGLLDRNNSEVIFFNDSRGAE